MLLPIEHYLEIMHGEFYRSTLNGCFVTVKLAACSESDLQDSGMLTADSSEAAALMLDVKDDCFWMPVERVYDVTCGRSRGLIVRQEADGNFRRAGFAQFVFTRAESVGMRTIGLV
jgi:hypothetical protein